MDFSRRNLKILMWFYHFMHSKNNQAFHQTSRADCGIHTYHGSMNFQCRKTFTHEIFIAAKCLCIFNQSADCSLIYIFYASVEIWDVFFF